MPTTRENLENPGIFVRITNNDEYTVLWTTGQGVVEMANEEQLEDEPISGFLKRTAAVHNLEQEDYDQWGVRTATVTLRSITLREAVHYLGRDARICAFLRPKPQAARFVNALEKGGSFVELKAAAEIRKNMGRFDKSDEVVFAEHLADYLEQQLLNITSGYFEP